MKTTRLIIALSAVMGLSSCSGLWTSVSYDPGYYDGIYGGGSYWGPATPPPPPMSQPSYGWPNTPPPPPPAYPGPGYNPSAPGHKPGGNKPDNGYKPGGNKPGGNKPGGNGPSTANPGNSGNNSSPVVLPEAPGGQQRPGNNGQPVRGQAGASSTQGRRLNNR